MINTIFYLFSILFIANNIYFISNKRKLQLRFSEKISFSKVEMLYYLFVVLFWVWVLTGLFSSMYLWFYGLMIVSVIRFPIYHISKSLYKSYEYIIPYLNVILLFSILKFYFT